MPELSLQCHPSTPCPWISAVSVSVDWLSDDLIVFYYRIEGDLDQLQLPAQHRSAHADGLWRQTCLEAFLRPRGANRYFEFNFSPSSEWAIYRFDGHRQGMQTLTPQRPPKIICRRRARELDADVDVHLGTHLEMLGAPAVDGLQLALAAVLQHQNGDVCYWALAHPEGKPDFHHASSFTVDLPRPPRTE